MIREYSVQVVTRMPEYRTLPCRGTRLPGLLAGAVLAVTTPAAGQIETRPVNGQLAGVVREADSGAPIAYALVLLPERNLRVLTSPSGRFAFPDVPPGRYRLDVRQIGFAPLALTLTVLNDGDANVPPPLVLTLRRETLVLPEMIVTAPVCDDPRRQPTDPAAAAIVEQAITNGERLLAMEREYPILARFERLTAGLVGVDSVQWFRWDTLTTRSNEIAGYERGRVVQTGRRAAIRYFTTSDVARPAFREHHCLWLAGLEEVAGERFLRIDFAPARRIRSADWSGALFLDPVTAVLRRSEATLVNVPRNAGGLRSTSCEVIYLEIEPTLVHEQAANCYTTIAGAPAPVRQERWQLLDWEFTGRRPGG